MTYESWRISYQSSESAAQAAWKEMIRLHHRVNELEAQLSAIGAGGVEPLRKSASQQAAHYADGVPAQIETLRAELAEEIEAAENWRRLALQFDHHRLQALGHLKAILHTDSSVDEYKTAELFLKAPPLDGESVLAQRIAELPTATQAQAVPQGWKITEEMHMAAVKVLRRASGVDGLPQRMFDAMLKAREAAPQEPQQ